jgi:glyoxylase-like metal-dependent hydrolase (beta-lactamase superfamily II)
VSGSHLSGGSVGRPWTPLRRSGWVEVGEGVYYRRYAPWDVNVGVVRGAEGLVVVDTRASQRQATELRGDLARLDPGPVRFVVNTHWHFDHCFGNFCFPEAAGYGHEALPGWLASRGEDARAEAIGAEPDRREEMDEVVITPPRHLVSSRVVLDLGDRSVELVHLGRGHTDHDLVVLAASVVFAGDLVEESGPPAYGADCFPLDWPSTLRALLDRQGDGAVVPGHGQAVDRAFAEAQAGALAEVAAIVAELHAAGVPVDAALAEAAGRWPWPPEALTHAVHRGYARLDGTAWEFST